MIRKYLIKWVLKNYTIAYYQRMEFVKDKEPVYSFSTKLGVYTGTMKFMKKHSDVQIEFGNNQ